MMVRRIIIFMIMCMVMTFSLSLSVFNLTSYAATGDKSFIESYMETMEEPDKDDGSDTLTGTAGTGTAGSARDDSSGSEGIPSSVGRLKLLDNDPLSNVGVTDDATESANTKLKAVGSGIATWLRTLSVLGMVLSIFGCAVSLMVNGYRSKNQVMMTVLMKSVIFLIIFSASTLISLVLNVVSKL